MMELDQFSYKSEYRSNEETTNYRWDRNPETDIVILDGDHLVGYISVLPIHRCLFDQIKSGSFNENEVERNVLAWQNRKVYYAYLSSIVVNKFLYPHFSSRHLFILLQEHLSKLRKRGIFIRGIIALAVSAGGRRILKKMKFREHGSNIFIFSCHRQVITFLTWASAAISPDEYSLCQLKVKDVDV